MHVSFDDVIFVMAQKPHDNKNSKNSKNNKKIINGMWPAFFDALVYAN